MSAQAITGFHIRTALSRPLRPQTTQRPVAPSHMTRFSPGERVGSFEILDMLGYGGTAEVYRASHPLLGQVALKISTNGYENMLRDEALALRKLVNRQNTSRILSYGLEDGWHCMALEYISGQTVSALLREGPVHLPKALDIITQVCYGLNNFHQQGLAHMDVKPGNILVEESGKSTLIDAGNAIPFPTEPATKIKATLSFCSPEQISGETADHRSDIYNLGLTLFSMLTGHHPFAGSDYEKAIEIKSNEVPMLPDTFHPQVRAIVGRMTARRPAERYQDVMDIVRDIRAFTENQ